MPAPSSRWPSAILAFIVIDHRAQYSFLLGSSTMTDMFIGICNLSEMWSDLVEEEFLKNMLWTIATRRRSALGS